jgi:hypothetical protein
MKLMELWSARSPEKAAFSAKDIPNFRVQLAVDNLFYEHNREEEVKRIVQTFNPKVTTNFAS